MEYWIWVLYGTNWSKYRTGNYYAHTTLTRPLSTSAFFLFPVSWVQGAPSYNRHIFWMFILPRVCFTMCSNVSYDRVYTGPWKPWKPWKWTRQPWKSWEVVFFLLGNLFDTHQILNIPYCVDIFFSVGDTNCFVIVLVHYSVTLPLLSPTLHLSSPTTRFGLNMYLKLCKFSA